MALDPDTLDQLIGGVRRFVEERLIPLEAQVAEEDRIPEEVVDEMHDLGSNSGVRSDERSEDRPKAHVIRSSIK